MSPRGRQRFGEFIANAFLGSAAAVGSTVLLPGVSGDTEIPAGVFVVVALVAVCGVAAAAGIRYITEQREGEEHLR